MWPGQEYQAQAVIVDPVDRCRLQPKTSKWNWVAKEAIETVTIKAIEYGSYKRSILHEIFHSKRESNWNSLVQKCIKIIETNLFQ